ncbi:hypothetical protein ZHAS_00004755 [Anopheles sinensis]|uniref:Uncharacterized protein n=1 Tax=Anopheles sinensis TaxID=74873 RepID=A0A084VHT3_ANOSI|nr:hypothetical protein ZHAS_00004755 [Anopheles sinensis]
MCAFVTTATYHLRGAITHRNPVSKSRGGVPIEPIDNIISRATGGRQENRKKRSDSIRSTSSKAVAIEWDIVECDYILIARDRMAQPPVPPFLLPPWTRGFKCPTPPSASASLSSLVSRTYLLSMMFYCLVSISASSSASFNPPPDAIEIDRVNPGREPPELVVEPFRHDYSRCIN